MSSSFSESYRLTNKIFVATNKYNKTKIAPQGAILQLFD